VEGFKPRPDRTLAEDEKMKNEEICDVSSSRFSLSEVWKVECQTDAHIDW